MNDGQSTALRADSSFMRRVWIDETIEVDASRDEVFATMAALDAWSSWIPNMVAIWRGKSRPAGVGTTFGMVIRFPLLQRVVLPCTISHWEPGCLEWGGGVSWSGVRHRFELSEVGERTRIRHSEIATGLLGLFFRPFEGFAHGFDHGWTEALRERFSH
jgi:Polyketide cyclase / dehydrase and lipid transport